MKEALNIVDTNRLDVFLEKYSSKHYEFACHAAIPRLFTTDFLYKLWLNFQKDVNGVSLEIPLLVVAELITTPICKQVGQDLFEFYPDIRVQLIKNLIYNPKFGSARKAKIAHFIEAYIAYNPNKIPSLVVREALLFEAKSIINPVGAINDLMASAKRDLEKETPNLTGIKKSLNFIENQNKSTPTGANAANPWKAAEDLINAILLNKQGKNKEAANLLQQFKDQMQQTPTNDKDILVPLSEEVLQELEVIVGQEEKELKRLHVLMVGINEYPDESGIPSINASLNSCKKIRNLLEDTYKNEPEKLSINTLQDKTATKKNIIENFENTFKEIEDGDFCLFFFSGRGSFHHNIPKTLYHAYPSKKMRTLVCYDSRLERNHDLYEIELSHLVWKHTQQKDIKFICLLDL